MCRHTLLAFGVVAVLGMGVASWTLPAQGPKEAPREEALSNKTVLVLSKQDGVGATLERTSIRTVGGRHFVVGQEVKDSPYTKAQFGGATVWIPLDDVTQLVELEKAKEGK